MTSVLDLKEAAFCSSKAKKSFSPLLEAKVCCLRVVAAHRGRRKSATLYSQQCPQDLSPLLSATVTLPQMLLYLISSHNVIIEYRKHYRQRGFIYIFRYFLVCISVCYLPFLKLQGVFLIIHSIHYF